MNTVGFNRNFRSSFSHGYCDELICTDPNFTSGYFPDDDVPLRRTVTPEKSYTEILSDLGNNIWNSFKECLQHVGNLFASPDPVEEVKPSHLPPDEPLKKKFSTSLMSISSLRHTEGKKLTANLYTREQLISVFEQIEKDIKKSEGRLDVLSDDLSASLDVLKERHSVEHLSIEEKAIISYSFRQLADLCSHLRETNKGELSLREQFVLSIVEDWNDTFEYWSRESLAEKIRVELAQKKQTKLGQLHSRSSSLMAGVATPGSQLGTYQAVGVKASHDRLNIIDAERFRNKYDLYMGGLYVEGAVGVEIPEAEIVKAQLKGAVDVQLMYGTFREPKTAMDEVVSDFNKLIQKSKYRNDANIAPYLSRAQLLNQEPDSNVADEVSDIVQLRHDFKSKKAGIDSRLSLYMSSRQDKKDVLSLNNESNKPGWASAPVQVAAGDVTEATVIGGVGKVTYGGEVKAEVEAKVECEALDISIAAGIGANASGFNTAEVMARNRSEVKRTLIGLRYVDATKTDEEKASIKQQVAANFAVFKRKLIQNVQQEQANVRQGYTELGYAVLNWARRVDKCAASQNEFIQFLNENKLDQDLVKLCRMADEQRPHLILRMPGLGEKSNVIDFMSINANPKVYLNFLKCDLEKYTDLHNAKVGPGQKFQTQQEKQRATRVFEDRYGATNPEELVHRMHVTCLYLLTSIDDIEDPENDALVDGILALEKTLSSPLFKVDKKTLEDRLYFLEDLNITLYQAKFDVETKVGAKAFAKVESSAATVADASNGTGENVTSSISIGGGVHVKTKTGVNYSYLSGHRSILRKGHSLQFTATLGFGCSVEAIIKDVTPGFNRFLPADIAQNALGELKEKLLHEVALSSSWTLERTVEIYLAKPDQLSENGKGFSLKMLYARKSASKVVDTTFKKTLGLSTYSGGLIPFDLVSGGGSIDIKTEPTLEMTDPDAILQYAIQYNHAYDVGEIDKITCDVQDDCYVREFENQPEMKQFFNHLAKESHAVGAPVGAITLVLDEFETAINDNPNYLKQLLVNFQTARRASTDATMIELLKEKIAAVRKIIKENKTADKPKTSNDLDGVLEEYNFKKVRVNLEQAASGAQGYDHAVDCLRKLQRTFSPHYLESKSNAPDLRPRSLAGTDTVAGRILQARTMMSGMLMGNG